MCLHIVSFISERKEKQTNMENRITAIVEGEDFTVVLQVKVTVQVCFHAKWVSHNWARGRYF